jgi:hypothetical protein
MKPDVEYTRMNARERLAKPILSDIKDTKCEIMIAKVAAAD